MNWYCIEYENLKGHGYEIDAWLDVFIGMKHVDFKWDDCGGHNFLCFKRQEDLTAFTIKWDICLS
jgi:hypothetical protein